MRRVLRALTDLVRSVVGWELAYLALRVLPDDDRRATGDAWAALFRASGEVARRELAQLEARRRAR